MAVRCEKFVNIPKTQNKLLRDTNKADHIESGVQISYTRHRLVVFPPKFYYPFCVQHLYSTFPKYYFTPATIDCLTANKTKNALHNEAVILNYIGGDPISHGLSN